jgi:DNA-binding beta-propeller fold protein YncE
MPLTVDRLRTVLAQAQQDSYLELLPDFVDLGPALELFKQYVQDEVLNIREVTVDPEALSLTGTAPLVGQAASPVRVSFQPDEDERLVVGFRVDAVLLPDGPGLPEGLESVREALTRLRLGPTHLVFGVEPGERQQPQPRVGFGVEVLFPTAGNLPRPYVWGYPPLWPGQSWSVASAFEGVPFPSLDELLVFTGLPATGFDLPADVLRECALALRGLAVTFFAGEADTRAVDSDWLSLWLRVGLDQPWQPLPGITVDELAAEFSVADPFAGPRLTAALAGRVTLADEIVVDVGVTLPERQLSGRLAQPVPVGAMLQQRFPGIPVPPELAVTDLGLWADLSGGDTRGYGVDLTLADAWHFAEGIDLSGIVLSLDEIDGSRTAGLTAVWTLLDGALDVTGGWTEGQGWSFLAHAANLEPAKVMAAVGVALPEQLAGLTIDELTVAFDSTGTFTFDCTAELLVGERAAALVLTVATGPGGSSPQVTGVLRLAVELPDGSPRLLDFVVDYASGEDGGTLTAAWTGTPAVSAGELAGALGLTVPAGIPARLLPSLGSVALRRDAATGRLVLASVTEAGGEAGGGVVLASAPGTPRALVLLVRAAIPARLSDLPLVGGQLPPGVDLGVSGVQLLLTSAALTDIQTELLNGDLIAVEDLTGQPYPRLPSTEGGLAKGAVLTVPYDVAGEEQPPLTLGFGGGGSGQLALRADAAGPVDAAWADIGRSFGPLHVYRIGVGYDGGRVLVMFDAALGASGLTIGVRGLGLFLDLDSMRAEPRLEGLSIELERQPLRVAGAFVNRQPPPEGYRVLVEGMLVVEMPKFGALAVGAYQRRGDGMTSLFAFGRATAPFGGPPPFRVTGFALGFGFNSGVRIPEQPEISGFPLVAGLSGGLPDDPLAVLAELTEGDSPWVAPRENQIWLAGGLDFTSFEFLQARVLLLLEAGQELTLALLGRATATFPKQGRPYARIGVDLRVVYQSARGQLAASAELVDSFVIDPAAALTGGFAFYLWFGPSPHAGDFVVTVGGYHPDYPVPEHFPVVPRLGFNWSLGPVSITGGAYFALTPNAVMAGGILDVRYKSGNVEAWLTARADILIQWAPLFFRAGISIRIGAKVKLLFTVKGELGASLDLWGPRTGGTVTAKFTFIKITVKFGAPLTGPDPLQWSEFKDQLLPQQAPLTVTPLTGLLTDADADPELLAVRVESGEEPWLVSPGGFSFAVATVVPTARLRFNDRDEVQGTAVDIRPMRVKGLDGLLSVTVDYDLTGQRSQWRAVPGIDDWQVAEQWDRVPFSLWGDPDVKDKDALSGDGLLSRLTGLTVAVPEPQVNGQNLGPVAEKDLAWEKLTPDAPLPLDPEGEPPGSPVRLAEPAGAGVALVADQLTRLAPAAARTRLRGVLDGLLADDDWQPLPNGTLNGWADQAATLGLDADPLLLTEDSDPPPPEPVVFVLDDTTQEALAVDAADGSVLLRIPLGQHGGYLVAVTGDGSRLYAVGAQDRQITVLDTAAARALPPIPTGLGWGRPTVFAVSADGGRAVVAHPGGQVGALVDLTGSSEPVVTLEQDQLQTPTGVAADIETVRFYGIRQDTGRTNAYDATDGELTGQSARAIGPVQVTPGVGDRVFVYGGPSGGNGAVQVIQPTPANSVYEPYNFGGKGTPLGLLTNSARNGVLLRQLASDGRSEVLVFGERQGSPSQTTLLSQAAVGPEARSLALDPSGRAWVLHQRALSVVQDGELLGELELEAEPLAITFTPDSARAFVACADATVAVIELTGDGPETVERWELPPGSRPSAARYTAFAATASEGAGR